MVPVWKQIARVHSQTGIYPLSLLIDFIHVGYPQSESDLNLNGLLVTHQIDNTSQGGEWGWMHREGN